jgi:hypothetical protein
MSQPQFFFLFAAVYMSPHASKETALGMAAVMTVVAFFLWVKGVK